MSAETSPYDPEHPWIKSRDEDPSQANWLQEFTDPTGTTRPPVFLRGQTMLGILRGFFFLGAFGAIASNPWIGAAVGAGGLFILLMMSLVGHIRRLSDAGKPPLLALVIVFPLAVALTSGVIGIANAPKTLEIRQAEMEEAKAARNRQTVASTGDTAAEEAEGEASEAAAAPPPQQRRRGPQGPLTIEKVLSGVVSQSLMTWLLLSFLSMIFTLAYVARAKPRT